MSVDLKVYGNHQLTINSVKEGLHELEEALGTKMSDIETKHSEGEVIASSQVEYFVDKKHLSDAFNRYNEITIQTSHKYCKSIRILRKMVLFKYTLRFSTWKKMLLREHQDNFDLTEIQKLKEREEGWIKFRQYASYVVGRIRGTKILYIDDSCFQNYEAGVQDNGQDMDWFLEQLDKIQVRPYSLEELALFKDVPKVRNSNCYYDVIPRR